MTHDLLVHLLDALLDPVLLGQLRPDLLHPAHDLVVHLLLLLVLLQSYHLSLFLQMVKIPAIRDLHDIVELTLLILYARDFLFV